MFALDGLNLVLGIAGLIIGGSWLIDGSSTLARWLKIPTIIVGLTVVSMGTSMPELFVNVQAAFAGSTGLALGNVIGSNIANILLVMAIGALITPLTLEYNTRTKDIPYALLATAIIIIFVSDIFLDGALANDLNRVESFALLGFFAIFLAYMYFSALGKNKKEISELVTRKQVLKSMAIIPAGIFFLAIGGNMTVSSSINIASALGVSERIIGLTIVAIGTSLPELVTTITASIKGKFNLLIGNIVGSNIFNIFFVLGVTGLIKPLQVENIPAIDFIFMIGAIFMLILFLYLDKKHTLQRYQGGIMLFTYICYITLTLLIR